MAHTTQFAQPGWRYLAVGAAGGAGPLPGGGTYVTLVAPGGPAAGATIIVESLQGKCLRADGVATIDQNVSFLLKNGLPGPGARLAHWRTTRDAFFVQQPDAVVGADGTVSLFLPADAIATLSTERSAARGEPSAVPPSQPFPLPYEDLFDGYAPGRDATARLFADVGGSWAVRDGALAQTVGEAPNANQWDIPTGDPFTYLGDASWADVAAVATVAFSAAAPATNDAARLGYDERALALLPCNTSDGDQLWQRDVVSPSFLALPSPRSVPSGAPICLDVVACGTAVDAFTCETDPGGCDPNEANLKWELRPIAGQPGQALVASLLGAGDGCLTLSAEAGALSVAPCGAAPAGAQQAWATALASGSAAAPAAAATLALASDLTRCLGLRAPPPAVYARICARLPPQAWVGAGAVPQGYCLDAGIDGRWRLQAGPSRGVVAEGALPAGYNASAPHAFSLHVIGANVSFAVDGAALGAWVDAQAQWASGYVGLGSGYHAAVVSSFRVEGAS